MFLFSNGIIGGSLSELYRLWYLYRRSDFSILLFLQIIVSDAKSCSMHLGFYDIVDMNLMVNSLNKCNLSRL